MKYLLITMLLCVGYGQKAITKSIDDVLRGREDCEDGWVIDCADDDCCPISWIGDGYGDCQDPDNFGCDLSCYDNDGGDCPAQEGDINDDGIVDVLDIIIAVEAILNYEYDISIDINEDDIINIADIILFINIVLSI